MTLHYRGRTLVLLAGAALVVTVAGAGCSSSSGNSPGGSGGAAATGAGGSGGSGGGSASGGASGSDGAVDAAVDAAVDRMVPTTSGVDRTKTLSSLSLDEQKKLCDFRAAKFDGYGKSIDCGNGTTVGSEDDQATCLGPEFLGGYCPTATVAQVEACTNDTNCDNPQPDSCDPLNACQ